MNPGNGIYRRQRFVMKIHCLLRLALLLALLITVGCSITIDPEQPFAFPTSSSLHTLAFPVQHKASANWAFPAAGSSGKLILENNCLRFGDDTGSTAIVWPYGSVVDQQNGTITVRNDRLGFVLSLNDDLSVGGDSFSDPSRYRHYLAEPIPDDCYPPYFLAGDIKEGDLFE